MLRKIVFYTFCLIPLVQVAQDYSASWEGYFSYLNVVDVAQGNGTIYAASDNAVFSYDIDTHELETISTVNGLSGETISAIHYSEVYGLLLIGYENGLMEVVSDASDDVLTVIDILEKPTIPPTDKKINHFNEYNEVVYIATDYGISVYNLANLEFGDTYYIGDLGAQTNINQTTVFDGYIYASSTTGLRKAPISSSNLIDFQQWQLVDGNNVYGIQSVGDKLYAVRSNNRLYEVINDNFNQVNVYNTNIVDVRNVLGQLVITTTKATFVYDSNFIEVATVNVPDDLDVDFTATAYLAPNDLFVGTTTNIDLGKTANGVLGFNLNDLSVYEEIHPEGPLYNTAFSVQAGQNELWLTFGDYTISYNPSPLRKRGISHLVDESWVNIPYDSVLGARNLNAISINPNNTNQVFISAFHDGILELDDNQPTVLYNNSNSGLEPLDIGNPNYVSIRVAGSKFDSNGLLWSVTSRIENALKSYNPTSGQWQSISFDGFIDDPLNATLGYGDLTIDNNGNKWIASYSLGVIGVKTNGTSAVINNIVGGADQGNLPSDYVSALAIDNNNQLWIGTNRGLRVLYNTESVFTETNPRAEEIIILDDGIAQELMYQQFVSDIEVDGSNNKWIGSYATGLFYFSSNGQETIYHFTKDNSPLPSNNIVDVSIDDATGKVYIATDKGLVAFKSGSSKPKETLADSYVYPNPVRPTFNINDEKVKINGLSENVNIKITDIEGNLVVEAQTNSNLRHKGYNLEIDGGTAFWNGKNLVNNTVASGVYLILISDLDTLETKVLKLMVVR